jgi:hypothetical protein
LRLCKHTPNLCIFNNFNNLKLLCIPLFLEILVNFMLSSIKKWLAFPRGIVVYYMRYILYLGGIFPKIHRR